MNIYVKATIICLMSIAQLTKILCHIRVDIRTSNSLLICAYLKIVDMLQLGQVDMCGISCLHLRQCQRKKMWFCNKCSMSICMCTLTHVDVMQPFELYMNTSWRLVLPHEFL